MKCEGCPVSGRDCSGETNPGLCRLVAAGGDVGATARRHVLAFAPGEPRPEPPLPGALTMAANLARALAEHAADGFAKADAETVDARLAVCRSCDRWRASDSRCSVCGCHTQAKAELQSSKCPLGKW